MKTGKGKAGEFLAKGVSKVQMVLGFQGDLGDREQTDVVVID